MEGLYNTRRLLDWNAIMRRTKEEAMETRKAILSVALDCFSKRGYALTTFSDIARRIHLTKGAVFWHFKSKEDLLAELIEREHAIYEPLKGVEAAQTPEDIRDVFVAWAEAVASHRELKRFTVFMMSRVEWGEALKQSLTKKLERLMVTDPFERLRERLRWMKETGVIETPLSVEQVATLMTGAFFGTLREAWLYKMPIDVVESVAAGLDFIVQGIWSK